jgi:hypothetical protein
LASGDYLKQVFPQSKIVASEALQCPTLLNNGFGSHRIEGIGDKHIPWVHNTKNTDFVVAVDDNAPMGILRLFNEEVGQQYLVDAGISESLVSQLHLLGISGIGNVLSAIKFAKYNEMTEKDVVVTMATDSMEMYHSRVAELRDEEGELGVAESAGIFQRHLLGQGIDNMQELGYYDRKRIHNLKYFTWVEQQGKSYEEIQAQWYDDDYWTSIPAKADEIDKLIEEFNARVAGG